MTFSNARTTLHIIPLYPWSIIIGKMSIFNNPTPNLQRTQAAAMVSWC